MTSPQVRGGVLDRLVMLASERGARAGERAAPAGTRLAPVWRIPRPAGAPASARGARIGPGGRDPRGQRSASSSAAAPSTVAGQAPASSATSASAPAGLERGQLGAGIRSSRSGDVGQLGASSATSATSVRPGTARGSQSVPERGCCGCGRSPVPGSAGLAAAGTAAAAGRFSGACPEPLEQLERGQLGDVGQAAAERRSASTGRSSAGSPGRRDPLCRDRAPDPPGAPAAPRGRPAAPRTGRPPARRSPGSDRPAAPLEAVSGPLSATGRSAPRAAEQDHDSPDRTTGYRTYTTPGYRPIRAALSQPVRHICPSDHQHTYPSGHMGRCTYAHALTSAYSDSTAAQMRRQPHD